MHIPYKFLYTCMYMCLWTFLRTLSTTKILCCFNFRESRITRGGHGYTMLHSPIGAILPPKRPCLETYTVESIVRAYHVTCMAISGCL